MESNKNGDSIIIRSFDQRNHLCVRSPHVKACYSEVNFISLYLKLQHVSSHGCLNHFLARGETH